MTSVDCDCSSGGPAGVEGEQLGQSVGECVVEQQPERSGEYVLRELDRSERVVVGVYKLDEYNIATGKRDELDSRSHLHCMCCGAELRQEFVVKMYQRHDG